MRQSIGLIFVAMLAICPESAWALANPASVFCAQSGGKSGIRKGPRGQYGVCRLPNGRGGNEGSDFPATRAEAAGGAGGGAPGRGGEPDAAVGVLIEFRMSGEKLELFPFRRARHAVHIVV